MKVKVIWTERFYLDDYDSREIMRCIDPGDFEEISKEDLEALRKNLHLLPRPTYSMEPRLVILDDEPVASSLEAVRKAVAKQLAERERAAEKRREAAARRKLSKVEKERAQFEELRRKFEGANGKV